MNYGTAQSLEKAAMEVQTSNPLQNAELRLQRLYKQVADTERLIELLKQNPATLEIFELMGKY